MDLGITPLARTSLGGLIKNFHILFHLFIKILFCVPDLEAKRKLSLFHQQLKLVVQRGMSQNFSQIASYYLLFLAFQLYRCNRAWQSLIQCLTQNIFISIILSVFWALLYLHYHCYS